MTNGNRKKRKNKMQKMKMECGVWTSHRVELSRQLNQPILCQWSKLFNSLITHTNSHTHHHHHNLLSIQFRKSFQIIHHILTNQKLNQRNKTNTRYQPIITTTRRRRSLFLYIYFFSRCTLQKGKRSNRERHIGCKLRWEMNI